MGKKGIKTQKEPIERNITKIKGKALEIGKGTDEKSKDIKKLFLLFRYTGMHPSVVFSYDYVKNKFVDSSLKEGMDDNGVITIEWNRPKKSGLKALTIMPKHPEIDFDVEEYYNRIRKRTSKYKKSRNYAHRLMKELGESVDVYGLSPLSFRHTLAVDLLRDKFPVSVVCEILNISPLTLKSYGKFVTEGRNKMLIEHWGLETK